MDALDILRDLASRPRATIAALRGRLEPDVLAAHPGGHDNSVAWLLWHTGREVDAQLAALTGDEQLWTERGHAERLGLGEVGDDIGYGHSPEQARSITAEDAAPLLDYADAALEELQNYLEMVTVGDLEEIVDPDWEPPVTRAARLVSILDDAIQHLAQASYVLGMPQRS